MTVPPTISSTLQNGNGATNLSVKVVDALSQCLTKEQESNKAPPGLDAALETLTVDGVTGPFLKAGFQAWFAYFLATDRDSDLKHAVKQLPQPALEHIASEVSKITAHSSVPRLIQHILFSSNRGAKRRKQLVNKVNLPEQELCRVPKRRRLSTSTGLQVRDSIETPNMTQSEELAGFGSEENHVAPTSYLDCLGTMNLDVNPQSQYAGPKAKNLPFIFPPHTCSAIVKNSDEAAIVLSFPSDPAACCLILELISAEVQYIARELFGVHIRERNKRNCVIFEHGATMEIQGSVTLRGTDSAALDKIFGQMVAAGLRQSPQYLEELALGTMKSNCLSMEIWGEFDRPSRLTFIVDAENLSLISQQLWRP